MHEGDFLVARYRLVRRIGRGAMGQVWLAHDNLLDRQVAIKHLLTGSAEALDDDVVKRAMREARVAAALNHANAVQIFDLVMIDEMPYVVMEYVEGETLADRMQAAGRMDPREVRPLIRQVAACLTAAHGLGIVHRDVKPANILITPHGVAKLADFGIARASQDADLTRTGLVIGTLAYMAPEVAAGDPATPASDVWSLGATAYAATEGRAPFAGESSARALYRKISEPPPVPTSAGELTGLMSAMMATEPTGRPTAHAAASALTGSGAPGWSSAPTAPPLEPTYVGPSVPRSGGLSDEDRYRATGLATPAARTAGPGTGDHAGAGVAAGPRPRRTGLVAAIVVLALVIAAGAIALVVSGRSSDKAAAGATSSVSTPHPTPTAASKVAAAAKTTATEPTTAPVSAVVVPPVSVPAVTSAAVDTATMTFYGPEDLSVDGPASWNNSCAGANGPYQWCAGPAGFLGSYFRLRLKSAHTASLATDVNSELTYFRTTYPDGAATSTDVSGWSVSGDAADVSYSFTNSQGQARRGIERVFTVDGGSGTSTLIIATTGPRSSWPQTQQVFQQLVGSARA